MATEDRGTAGMSKKKRTEISSKGGKAQGAENNPANFANDRTKAKRAGENSHGGGNS